MYNEQQYVNFLKTCNLDEPQQLPENEWYILKVAGDYLDSLGYKIKITNKNDKWQIIAKNNEKTFIAEVINQAEFSNAIMSLVDMVAKTKNT